MTSRQGSAIKILGALCGAALVACAFSPDTAAAQQNAPAPTFTVTAREVLLDIVAIGPDGQPVAGLKTSDFTVTEEGAPQTIRRLEEHGPLSAADGMRLKAAPVLPPNTFSNYAPTVNRNACTVLLLDAMDTPVAAQMYLRDQVIAYLKNMQPGPSIAIFQLDTAMHLVQGFSSNPAVLLAAAESKRNQPSVAKPIRGDAYFNYRTRTDLLRAGMQMIGRYLAAFPGRKNLIWFTGEVPATIFGVGLGNPFPDSFSLMTEDMQDITGALLMSRVAVYPVDTRGLEADPTYSASRGGMPAPSASGHWSMRQGVNHMNLDEVAGETGGKAYYNTNNLKQVIAEAIQNGSSYYTLAYATTNAKWEGQFRRIRISVDRSDVHLQYRTGYRAINRDRQQANQLAAMEKRAAKTGSPVPRPADQAAAAGAPPTVNGVLVRPRSGFDEAMGLGAIPPTEIVFAASLQPADSSVKLKKDEPLPQGNYLQAEWQHKPFRNYTLLLRADAHRIAVTRSPDGVRHGKVLFALQVYNAEGQPVNSFTETESFNLGPAPYRELLVSGLLAKTEIAIPVKGNYFLRLGVHDLTGDRIGAFEIPVDQIKLGVAGQDLQAH